MTLLELAKSELEYRKDRLRQAAMRYVVEVVEDNERDGDAMADLESKAMDFYAAKIRVKQEEEKSEMEYLKEAK